VPPKLFIATPCYGGLVTDHFLMSLLNLTRVLAGHGVDFDFRTVSDSLITRARNHMASEFLRDDSFTHLLFIDADLGFDPNAVPRYLAFAKDLVCGVYPLKRLDIGAVRASPAAEPAVAEASTYFYSSTVSLREDNQPEDGFLRAEYGATGFMLIARAVLERLAAAHPELRYGGDHSVWSGGAGTNPGKDTRYAFFDTMIADGHYLPEDYSFCKRWRQIGGEIWIDLHSRFSHVGSYVYRGDLGVMLSEAQRQGRLK
jgi:hypothetical protein